MIQDEWIASSPATRTVQALYFGVPGTRQGGHEVKMMVMVSCPLRTNIKKSSTTPRLNIMQIVHHALGELELVV